MRVDKLPVPSQSNTCVNEVWSKEPGLAHC